MKQTFFVIFLILELSGCSTGNTATTFTDKTSFEEGDLRLDSNHLPITGFYHKYDTEGKLSEEIQYNNGKINGIYKVYN